MSYIHKCPTCGKEFTTVEQINPVKCPFCGNEFTVSYGEAQQQQQQQQQQQYQQPSGSTDVFSNGPSGKSRGVAGLLAILLGTLGVHYFYCGRTTAGVIFLLVSVLSCGILATVTGIVSLIQGILMFTMNQETFEQKYVNTSSTLPLF